MKTLIHIFSQIRYLAFTATLLFICVLSIPNKSIAQYLVSAITDSSGLITDAALNEQLARQSDSAGLPNTLPEPIDCHCFGVITTKDSRNNPNAQGSICFDFGGPIGTNFDEWPCKTESHYQQCCQRVQYAVANLTSAQLQAIANCFCTNGAANGAEVEAFSKVGTSDWERCQLVGHLNVIASTLHDSCNCPKGWLSNDYTGEAGGTANVDGGRTNNQPGGCKQFACGPIPQKPWPANSTPINGSWGFWWNGAIWAYGTAANGGAAHCVTIGHPEECSIH